MRSRPPPAARRLRDLVESAWVGCDLRGDYKFGGGRMGDLILEADEVELTTSTGNGLRECPELR